MKIQKDFLASNASLVYLFFSVKAGELSIGLAK
jgi:hypothetical protein